MRAILIGAGRGSRLQHHTDQVPKTLVPVHGRPMLDWILDALEAGGVPRRDVTFIAGYRMEVLRARHPEFTWVHNSAWEQNNILLSLLCARELLSDGFLCSYTDIVYAPGVVRALLASPHDMVLGCDTAWRRRYVGRSQHPETDAEKLRAEGERVLELSRRIPSEEACGEFVGVARFTARGARELLGAFDEARERFQGRTFREGRSFERAYLIDLLQWMLERGSAFHRVDTHGGYMEIDTVEDLEAAPGWFQASPELQQ
ncbi:MAG: phosphocholine cytidylyltransferase family protein [Deltaproteobacteria bacterium]|nr:phosphocholine cytidylyltransferase family protein [Deltaproteobacteria bacterium]